MLRSTLDRTIINGILYRKIFYLRFYVKSI